MTARQDGCQVGTTTQEATQGGTPRDAVFRIPQQYALAHRIITSWLVHQEHHTPTMYTTGKNIPPRENIPPAAHSNTNPTSSTTSSSTVTGGNVITSTSSNTAVLDAVPTVRIDAGVFKYILARVVDTGAGVSKLVVRGDVRAGYHDQLLQHLRKEAHVHGLNVGRCGGGGKVWVVFAWKCMCSSIYARMFIYTRMCFSACTRVHQWVSPPYQPPSNRWRCVAGVAWSTTPHSRL